MTIVNWSYYPDGWTINDRNAKFDSANLFHKGLIPLFATGFGSGTYIDWMVMILRIDNSWWNQYYSNTACTPGSACRTNLGTFLYEFPKESSNVPVEFVPGEWTEGSTFTIGKVGIWGPEQGGERRYWGFFGLIPDNTIYSINMTTGFNIAIPENADSFCNDSYDLLSGVSRDFVTGDIFNYNILNGILFGISTSQCTPWNGAENFILVVKSNGILYRGYYPSSLDVGAIHNLSVRSFLGNTILSVNGIDRVTVPAVPLGKLKPLWGIASFSDNTTNPSSPEVYFKNITLGLDVPIDIAATSIVPSPSACTEPCDTNIYVTWTNNGGISGTFTPTITVNNIEMSMSSTETLNPSQSVTITFPLTNLSAGPYDICAIPNTFPCVTLTVNTPVNIVATSIIPTPSSCTEPCDLTVDVTYENSGQTSGTFTPEITIDGISSTLTSDTLNPSQTVIKIFSLTNLTAGTHSICVVPLGTTTCQTITVNTPANILATSIIPSMIDCTTPCDLTVDVTYENSGQTSGTFTPEITMDGISSTLTSDTLDPSQTVIKIFSLTNLTAGTHSICVVPLGTTTCQTITVNEVVEASIGKSEFVMIGLAFGLLVFGLKENKCKKGYKFVRIEGKDTCIKE